MASDIPKKIKAAPTKNFFIKTLVKDISLIDSILDLIDNSIDSHIQNEIQEKRDVKIILSKDSFIIEDNCGGIKKENIYNNVFQFGKMSHDNSRKIGVYGIGLKRSIFKMGENILLESDDGNNFFSVRINKDWLNDDDNWDLDFEKEDDSTGETFLKIKIVELFPNIGNEFENNLFKNKLVEKIKKTYPVLMDKRVNIYVNDELVETQKFELLNEKDFNPLHKKHTLEIDTSIVEVEIYAGFTSKVSKDDPYGWYVFCNDRLIIEKDHSDKTGWEGLEKVIYHYPADNYFLGLIFFRSDDASLLPWTTTKNDIQLESRLYRQFQGEMNIITSEVVNYIRYIDKMKDIDGETVGKSFYKDVSLKSIFELESEQVLGVPKVSKSPVIDENGLIDEEEIIDFVSKKKFSTIQYVKEKKLIKMVKESFNDPHMSNKAVGEKTFDYYVDMEELDYE